MSLLKRILQLATHSHGPLLWKLGPNFQVNFLKKKNKKKEQKEGRKEKGESRCAIGGGRKKERERMEGKKKRG